MDEARKDEIDGRADMDFRIGGLRDERRKPADLKIEANDHQKIGLPEFQKKAGLGFNEVRVLVATGDGLDSDLVAADLLRQRGEVGGGSHDLQCASGMRERWQDERSEKRKRCCQRGDSSL